MEDSGTSESGSAHQEVFREEVAVNWVLEYWLGFGGGDVGRRRCFRLRTDGGKESGAGRAGLCGDEWGGVEDAGSGVKSLDY